MNGRYYHGGTPGLRVGDRILPPEITGRRGTADAAEAEGLPAVPRDRVFATVNLFDALVYAALATVAGGDVYEVELDGPVEDEVPGRPGGSVAAPGATVVEVVRREVPLSEAAAAIGEAMLLEGAF